jgi:hypothetical protein
MQFHDILLSGNTVWFTKVNGKMLNTFYDPLRSSVMFAIVFTLHYSFCMAVLYTLINEEYPFGNSKCK